MEENAFVHDGAALSVLLRAFPAAGEAHSEGKLTSISEVQ